MEIVAIIGGKRYQVNVQQPRDISIPVRFDGGVSAFGAAPARKEAYTTQGFVGNVGKGGSCNCDVLSFAPHLHGTHTECVGHISKAPIAVCDILKQSLIPAALITVAPKAGQHDNNTYIPKLRADDTIITKDQIHRALLGVDASFLEALIVRTLPNGPEKTARDYQSYRPPFFSVEAMHYLVSSGIRHLLADIPSIDRPDDEGKLTNHHIFWEIQDRHAVNDKNPSPKTVSELIYVSDDIADGTYMLDLQVAPIAADAAPSRPMLYEVKRL